MTRGWLISRPLAAVGLAACMAGCGQPAAADRLAEEPIPATTAPTPTPAPAAEQAPGIAGSYRMEGARVGNLTLQPGGSGWKIALRGGVPTDAGAATPADCELQAEGALIGDRIDGVVIPFEGDINSLTAQDLQGYGYGVKVTIRDDTASVVTDYDGCGVGADLNGDYRRAAGG